MPIARSLTDVTVVTTVADGLLPSLLPEFGSAVVETPETVAARIRRALPYVPADKLVVAPDCGMKYLPREVAFGKMKAMAEGAAIVRREFAGK